MNQTEKLNRFKEAVERGYKIIKPVSGQYISVNPNTNEICGCLITASLYGTESVIKDEIPWAPKIDMVKSFYGLNTSECNDLIRGFDGGVLTTGEYFLLGKELREKYIVAKSS